MSWSGRRRGFFLLVFFLIITGALAAGVAYFWPSPTCEDRRQNQDELGVDCGGSCAAVCPFEPKPLVAGWARVFHLQDEWYDVAGLLVNPNANFGVARVPFRFRLVDANNLLVSLEEGEAFLNPGESFVVFAPRVSVGRRTPVRAALELTGLPVWYRAGGGVRSRPVVVRQRDFSADPLPLVRATLENTTNEELFGVQATAVLSDGAGNAFAASATVLERLPAGTTREVSFTWPEILPIRPAVIDVFAHAAPSTFR